MHSDSQKTPDFHLVSYKTKTTTLRFVSPMSRANGSQITVVIGPNGSGKSRVLAEVINELVLLAELLTSRPSGSKARTRLPTSTSPSSATVEYFLDSNLWSITRVGSELTASLNGRAHKAEDLPFPEKAFAVAHLPVDRFRFSKNDSDSFYSYLGLRQSTNLTTTGALEVKVLMSLIRGSSRSGFAEQFSQWLQMLGLTGPGLIHLRFSNRMLVDLQDPSLFSKAAYLCWSSRNSKSGGRAIEEFQNQYANEIEAARTFFSEVTRFMGSLTNRQELEVKIQLTSDIFVEVDRAIAFASGIEAARALRLLTGTSLILNKDGNEVGFAELSSGEQQVLGTTTRLLAEIKANSFVVIDEPEVSLHPVWQIRYIPTLLDCLKAYPATHVVIATHSHFLVSDVDPTSSSLVVASVGNSPKFELFDGDVYGRSPENILYRVFGVTTTGNFFVENDLTDALAMLSGKLSYNESRLRAINIRLSRVAGNDNAALLQIVREIESALGAQK